MPRWPARSLQDRFLEKVIPEPNSGCWLWAGAIDSGTGYGRIGTTGRAVDVAHRVSWQLHCECLPQGKMICHKCDNRLCVNPDHLFLGDHAANGQDMSAKGRSSYHRAKMTPVIVAKLKSELAVGVKTGRALAKEYGISTAQISRIKSGQKWPHVKAA